MVNTYAVQSGGCRFESLWGFGFYLKGAHYEVGYCGKKNLVSCTAMHIDFVMCKNDAKNVQQTGRRVPIQLQNQVDKEIDKLLKKGHIEKVDKIQDDVFIHPTVITVKIEKSVKNALDGRALNQSIAKGKCQMPNLDNLFDMIVETLHEKKRRRVIRR